MSIVSVVVAAARVPDRFASRAAVARAIAGVGCVAVVVVAAVATAGAGCPGAGVATSWKLKKFGRENYNNQ